MALPFIISPANPFRKRFQEAQQLKIPGSSPLFMVGIVVGRQTLGKKKGLTISCKPFIL
jgi:hypothetical protein